MRVGLLVVGLATLLVAADADGHTDIKRMLAYSSMEKMGLIAIAAAAGTTLAIAALLLHVARPRHRQDRAVPGRRSTAGRAPLDGDRRHQRVMRRSR